MFKWFVLLLNRGRTRVTGDLIKLCNIDKDDDDNRDFVYVKVELEQNIPTIFTFSKTSLNKFVKNQGSIGSCGSHVFANTFEIMNKLQGRKLNTSELFHYYITREYEGHLLEDWGMQLRNGAKMLKRKGIALERFHPYNVNNWLKEPNFRSYVTARALRIKAYYRIFSIVDMKKRLYFDKKPIILGIKVWQSFLSNKTGSITMPRQGERYVGGHAVVIVGFDDNKQKLQILNSWGKRWGDNGFAWVPYKYINENMLDMWTIDLY